jgi:histidinol-phosphate aminotransferase
MPEITARADALFSLLRPELADLVSYVPHDPPGIQVKLDANEAPPAHSAAIQEAVLRAVAATRLERYPDPRASRLREAIAKRTGAKADDLLVGAGSDEVIALVVNALARPRSNGAPAIVMSPVPTFVMYRMTARAHGMKPVEIPLDASWDLDVAMAKRAIAMMPPNVVFVASPNNPTGNRMSDPRLEELVAADPGAFTIVDEAYVDYAEGSVRGWRARFPHMGVLRTLSKIGLAALRVGWLEADAALIAEIDKVRQPFNLSATSQAAAAAVLEDAWDAVQAEVAAIKASRERLARAIAELPGYAVTPSSANFVWVKTPRPAEAIAARLAEDGVLVRSFHKSGGRLTNQIRVTVGTDSDHERLLASLARAEASR